MMSSYNGPMSVLDKKKLGKYHHGNLRATLIASAVNLLEIEGVAALSLRRIARESGVSEAAPYSHFRNKKDLLTAVCVEGTVWFGQYMQRKAAGRQGIDYLAGLATGYIHFAMDHPALFQLMNTRNVSESLDDEGRVPKVFAEGYEMLAAGLAAAPLQHFGVDQQQLDIPLAWAQVYGLANLLLEGRITPEAYGFDDLESFIEALVNKFLQNIELIPGGLGGN